MAYSNVIPMLLFLLRLDLMLVNLILCLFQVVLLERLWRSIGPPPPWFAKIAKAIEDTAKHPAIVALAFIVTFMTAWANASVVAALHYRTTSAIEIPERLGQQTILLSHVAKDSIQVELVNYTVKLRDTSPDRAEREKLMDTLSNSAAHTVALHQEKVKRMAHENQLWSDKSKRSPVFEAHNELRTVTKDCEAPLHELSDNETRRVWNELYRLFEIASEGYSTSFATKLLRSLSKRVQTSFGIPTIAQSLIVVLLILSLWVWLRED